MPSAETFWRPTAKSWRPHCENMNCASSSEKDTAIRRRDQYRRDTALYNNINAICEGMHRIFPDIIPEKLKAHLLEGRKKESKYWPVYVKEVTTLPLKKRENRIISYIDYTEVKKLPLFKYTSSLNPIKIDMRTRPYGDLANCTVGKFKDTPPLPEGDEPRSAHHRPPRGGRMRRANNARCQHAADC